MRIEKLYKLSPNGIWKNQASQTHHPTKPARKCYGVDYAGYWMDGREHSTRGPAASMIYRYWQLHGRALLNSK